jgi:hypothetical protein
MAQVYSVNAVGYVNTEIPAGGDAGAFALICNPLDAGEGMNTVGNLITGINVGSFAYKFNNATGTYDVNQYLGVWTKADMSLAPGEGIFFLNPVGGAAVTITFVGEVKQGDLSTPIAKGFQFISSQVPQAGLLSTDLGFPAAAGDQVFQFNKTTQAYVQSNFFGVWAPAEPTVAVGEAVFLNAANDGSWDRTFSVND